MTRSSQALLVGLAGVLGGCYSPDIQDGQLGCSPKGECPDGFRCGPGNRCFSTSGGGGRGGGGGGVGGSGGGTDAAVMRDTPGAENPGPPDGGPGMDRPGGIDLPVGVDAPLVETGGMCVGPFAGCSASLMTGQRCDPVCQAGCSCSDRCELLGRQTQCTAVAGARQVGESCVTTPADDCAPGLACLRDECGNRCYRYCRQDSECSSGRGRARCDLSIIDSNQVDTGFRICDVPITGCHPLAQEASRSCGAGFGCYLLGNGDETGCDCPGRIPEGVPCTYGRECAPGYICTATAASGNICRPVCLLGQPSSCPSGLTCYGLDAMSMRYGFCDV